jgi:hypothetical protein
LTKELHLNERSAFEWLAGVHLPKLYRKYFGNEPGFTRNAIKDEISGAYISFAEQTLSELGICSKEGRSYSRSSIADALTKARAGKRRRIT